jgi:NAD(P)-dependent dehydrogenase (short-subunit alcohol dehydrogenase family)
MPSYLVAGSSRGIGLALVQLLAVKPNTSIVYASIRDPKAPIISNLNKDKKIHPIQLDITSQPSVDAAVETVKNEISSLDVLIIAAGVAMGTFTSVGSAEQLEISLQTNTISVYRTTLAFLPLIRAGTAKIIALGTPGGTFSTAPALLSAGIPIGTYSIAKAALHFMMMVLDAELTKEGIVTATVDPGIMGTDMAKEMAERGGQKVMKKFEEISLVPVSAEESAESILKIIKGMGVEKSGKLFGLVNGEAKVLPF